MIKKVFVSLFIMELGAACSNIPGNEVVPERSIELAGKITNPQDGLIILEEFVRDQNQYVVTDTIPLNLADKSFRKTISFNQPGYFRLNLFNKQFISLILDEDNINIEADGSSQVGFVKITGSSDIEKLSKLAGVLKSFAEKGDDLNTQYAEAISERNTAMTMDLTEQYKELQKEKTDSLKVEIKKMGICLATLQALNLINKDTEFEFVNDISGKLTDKYPDVSFVKDLAVEMERLSKLAIGQLAPEISLPNPQGDIVKLSSLRGRYVLVDFWAEWCKPCRLENPNVLRAYNKYKDKGFEVYGVSLDRTKEKWLKGIEEDGLPWTHVSDLQYFNSEAAIAYHVNAIPFSVLLDRDGKIIAKNLSGNELHRKLEEIFTSM